MNMPKGKQFNFSTQQIFGRFDLFCRRVEKRSARAQQRRVEQRSLSRPAPVHARSTTPAPAARPRSNLQSL